VTFRSGVNVLANNVTLSFLSSNSARANFSTSLLWVTNHSITAEYVPTGLFEASTSGALQQTVNCPVISLDALGDGEVGLAYSDSAAAAGGSYSYNVTSGSLPPGLTLDGGSGLVSGTPTQAGPFSFRITASDTFGCSGFRDYALTIDVPAIETSVSSNRNPSEFKEYVTFSASRMWNGCFRSVKSVM